MVFVCGRPNNGTFMIYCDICDVWSHGKCVGVNRNNSPDDYFCPRCTRATRAILMKSSETNNNLDSRMKAFDEHFMSSIREEIREHYLQEHSSKAEDERKAEYKEAFELFRKDVFEKSIETYNYLDSRMTAFHDQIISSIRKEMEEHLQEHSSKAEDARKAAYEEALELFRRDMFEENAKSVQQYEENLTVLKNQLLNQQKEYESYKVLKERKIEHLKQENKEKETELLVLKGKIEDIEEIMQERKTRRKPVQD